MGGLAKSSPNGFGPLVGAFLRLGLVWLLGAFDRSVPGEDGEAPRPELTRIAVLPFENMSPDPGNEYFTDGITHDTSYQLSKIDRLAVISRTSVMSLKNSNKTIREIGEELKVQAVLEGSVRREGERVRIIAQLIDVATEEHLWEQSYERELKDIFAIQSGVAKQIASALQTELSAEEVARIEKDPTGNLDAYHSYLKGLYFLDKRTEEGIRIAITHFEGAVQQDSDYALAHAGLANSYALLATYGALAPKDVMPRVEETAQRALEIDETLAEAHTALANAVLSYRRDWQRARKHFELALEFDPNYSTARHWYALFLATQGHLDDAVTEMNLAQELDPVSPIIKAGTARCFYYKGQYDLAIEGYREALEMDPNLAPAHFGLGLVFTQKSMYEDATKAFRKGFELLGGHEAVLAALILAFAGERDGAREALEQLETLAKTEYVPAIYFALVYSFIGEKDQAFKWLTEADQEGSDYVRFLKVEPWFKGLRSDARFEDLLKLMNLSP